MGWLSSCSILCLPLFVLHSLSYSFAFPSCRDDQSSALLHFKNSFSIRKPNPSSLIHDVCDQNISYPKTLSWENGTNCCLWDGITCNRLGHITGLNLSCSWLHGKILPNSNLFQLTHLQRLDLGFNDFEGSHIPSNFSQLVSMTHLYLCSSNICGEVPSQISHLNKLVSLDLSGNYNVFDGKNHYLSLKPNTWESLVKNLTDIKKLQLSDIEMSSIPPSHLLKNLSSSLVSLGLRGTGLQGNFEGEIPFSPHLQEIDLSDNVNLMGHLSESNWNNSLRLLNLSGTGFFGELPHSFDQMKFLNELDLSSCQFAGKIPTSFWNLTKLSLLHLSKNKFFGQISSSISNLQNLNHLLISSNNFSGQFPSSISKLRRLQRLGLSNNGVQGHLPASLWNLTQLTFLALSHNKFSGRISSSLANLQNLNHLFLSSNNFSGQFPSSILKLTNLQRLGLSDNGFDGYLPTSLWNLTQLTFLALSNNNFSGQISSSLSNLQNLNHLFLSSNNFCGQFPSAITKLKNLKRLVLSNNGFQGHVPASLWNLTQLTFLALSTNNFSGHISSSISNLQDLTHLFLFSNNFSGQLPSSISKLKNLQRLALSNNGFRGHLPASIWNLTQLAFLDLSQNFLTGFEPFLHLSCKNIYFLDLSSNSLQGELTSSICNASSLEILNLSHNNFTGTIPHCIGSTGLALSVLDLKMNSFSSTIPDIFEVGNNLRTLNLHGNLLEGPVPRSLVNCTKLKVLDLGKNAIEDTFPFQLQALEELQVLVLRENKLHGFIPDLMDNTNHAFLKLRVFDLSSNNLSGPLPATFFTSFEALHNVEDVETGLHYISYGNSSIGALYHDSIQVTLKGLDIQLERIFTIFTTIDLSNNRFEGEIPKLVGELGALKGLNFSHNRLTGTIPSSIGNLRNLEWLDLSSNKLIGKIPAELTNLNFLSILNLSQNQLEGCIPRGQQFETFTSDSFEENMGLRGFPLATPCMTHEERQPSRHSENGIEFGWKPVLLGYVCGAVFGAIMFKAVVFTGRPRWIASMVNDPPKKRKGRARNRSS